MVRSFWSRFSLFVAKKLSQKLWNMVYADFYGMPLSFLRRKTARLLSRGSEDPAIFRKVDQTFLFPLCIFSSTALVFFFERACVPENNNDCSNFLILHGFLWPPSEKQWKNRARERFSQGYSAPFIAHRPYLPVNCGHNSGQTRTLPPSPSLSLASFLTVQSSFLFHIFIRACSIYG